MSLKIAVSVIYLCLSLLAVAEAHESDHADQPTTIKPPVAAVPPKALAARFNLRIDQLQTEWFLWRTAEVIETTDLSSGQSNIWERQGSGNYSFRRIFHRDLRIIEYTPGEIRTRNAQPNWAKLASVVSPQLLGSLKPSQPTTKFGQKAMRYRGNINGQMIDLCWLEESQLPAQLKIVGRQHRMELSLKEIVTEAPKSWPQATDERIAHYNKIDAADLGDMEYDPFVVRVMQLDGHQHF